MDYSNILKFKYTWRKYQARVLENTKEYVADGKVHIVAAPGSGKTTLGIELIARMRENALVLAPSVTIREQWKDRIVEGFLIEGLNPDDYISQDLKNPKAITIATYQALHSAMNRYKGNLDESAKIEDDKDADDTIMVSAKEIEEVDYSEFDIVKTLKANKVGLMCLDECHHLRSEWWKALEELKNKMGGLKVIALTATPPYDSNATMWNRYMNMCGEIDEEIAVPELVKEGSLPGAGHADGDGGPCDARRIRLSVRLGVRPCRRREVGSRRAAPVCAGEDRQRVRVRHDRAPGVHPIGQRGTGQGRRGQSRHPRLRLLRQRYLQQR